MQTQKTVQDTVKMVVVGGFLGAGKTTTMVKMAQMFEANGKRAGVIMNDQGDQLVDTEFGKVHGLGVAEVTGGCFCCQFDDLVDTTVGLVRDRGLDVVLAEAVGSCTDLNATVIRPLREYYRESFEVAPLTVMVDPSRWRDLMGNGQEAPESDGEELVSYLFRKQLEEANVIALNKIDLLQDEELEDISRSLQDSFPSAQVVAISAETGEGLDQLLELWSGPTRAGGMATSPPTARVLDIDYQKYADAEAVLAWLNTTLNVRARGGEDFRPAEWVSLFLSELSAECERRGYVVGHAKAQLSTPDGWTKASLVRAGDDPVFSSQQWTGATGGEILVNIRVEVDPDTMRETVENTVASVDDSLSTESEFVHMQSFSPAPPRPTHRMVQG